MKLGTILGAATLVAVTAFITSQVISQEGKPAGSGHKEKGGEPSAAEAEMMKKWMEAATPGEPHKMLAKRVGKWNYTMEMRMDPNAPWDSCTGTSEFKTAIGGRFILQTANAQTSMGPFEGMGATGYDNVTKKYVETWMDNWSTTIMYMEGTADAAGKVITSTGTSSCPTSDEPQKLKIVTTWVDDNNMHMSGYGYTPDNKEFESMRIKYTRAK